MQIYSPSISCNQVPWILHIYFRHTYSYSSRIPFSLPSNEVVCGFIFNLQEQWRVPQWIGSDHIYAASIIWSLKQTYQRHTHPPYTNTSTKIYFLNIRLKYRPRHRLRSSSETDLIDQEPGPNTAGSHIYFADRKVYKKHKYVWLPWTGTIHHELPYDARAHLPRISFISANE